MATELIMPRLPDQQQSFAHFYTPNYNQYNPQSPGFQSQTQTQTQQIYTQPQISPLSTSNNTSPTSPKSYHGRQVRPLYMPAVLRPTERQKTRGSISGKKTEDDNESLMKTSNNSFISLAGLGALGRLNRRGTGDSGKCVDENEWNFALFPQPTAQPTKHHWKSDADSTICDEPSCMRHFNYWTRRHHCRRCGNIFCDPHSAFEIPLDQDANYNPRGTMSRACQHCYNEFKSWRSRTNSQASSISSGSSDAGSAYHINGSSSDPSSPVDATGAAPIPAASGKGRVQHKEIAASVPRDWNWSTF
ncbi:hypothetical protein PG996_002241 [Apiospora saccharicola]|uniref:FYVE-type domain-containing protein n=1 Tax=Apiospora saccharicola TaxID=335842 RepID=A0ABR1WIX8_9PEZI